MIDKNYIIAIGIVVLASYAPFSVSKNKNITLTDYLKNKFDLPIFIENDTRSISSSEQIIGLAKGVNDALVIKASRLMGMCIIVNKKIITGKNGFAGNFTHTQYECGKRNCICGKIDCVGTLIGGNTINLLNPELIIISVEYTSVKGIFINAARLGSQQTTIRKNLENCKIMSSNLGRFLNSKGY